MNLDRQRTRRLAATIGAAAALTAVPLVLSVGTAGQSFGEEPVPPNSTSTEIVVPPETTTFVPTVEPDPGAPGNPEGENGDIS
ncbi:MAG: hypothetical protein HYZ38_00415 [Mycobacterium sp.]|nr:hypothetical protein [Mycobacterium sp.]